MNLADLGWASILMQGAYASSALPRMVREDLSAMRIGAAPTKVQAFVDFGLETIR
jgi:hypothetical protein